MKNAIDWNCCRVSCHSNGMSSKLPIICKNKMKQMIAYALPIFLLYSFFSQKSKQYCQFIFDILILKIVYDFAGNCWFGYKRNENKIRIHER